MNIPISIPRFDSRSLKAIRNDISDELEFHIQCRVDDLVAEGYSNDEAEKKAQQDFGSTESIQKQCEQINVGRRQLVTVLASIVFLSLTVLVSWLTWQLWLVRGQNAKMAQQLLATAPAVPTIAPQSQLNDLTGTVTGPDGPIENAKVLLIYKSWPNGNYRQESFATTTDAKGKFTFEDLYSTSFQTAYLVSIVKEGYTLESKYWVHKRRSKVRPVRMKVKKAVEKVLTILGDSNQPLANTDVFVKSRNTRPDGSGGDKIYSQSRDDIMLTTDEEGKVDMSYFAAKDKALIATVVDGEIVDYPFKVDTELEQTVGGSSSNQGSLTNLTGKVIDENGNPVQEAAILLVHKDWANGYRQEVYKTTTNGDGKFAFPNRYDESRKYAFLVSVIADGWAMKSEYVFKKDGGKQRAFRFKLRKAVSKKFIFEDSEGNALDHTYIFPSTRKSKSGDEYTIYAQSGPDISTETDRDGSAEFNIFTIGDIATFRSEDGGTAEIEIDDEPVQYVTIKKKVDRGSRTERWEPSPVSVSRRQIEWLEQNAIRFKSIDPEDTDFEDLQPLKELIGDAQIVQLGEQSHGDGTCFETKIRLVKFLHQEMGFDVIAFESGLYDCHKAWESFQRGNGPLDSAREGVFAIWTGSHQTGDLWEYIAEKSNSDNPLELAGFDCQFTAAASRNHLLNDTKTFINRLEAGLISDEQSKVIFEQMESLLQDSEPQRVDGFDTAIEKLITSLSTNKTPGKDQRFWIQNLRSIRELARYRTEPKRKGSLAMDRDAQMARNLVWLHQKAFPGRKIIVWAASFHIMRSPAGIKVPDGKLNYKDVVPMGDDVHKALGDRVFSICFTANEGTAGTFFRAKFDIGTAPEGTLENIFSQTGIDNGLISLKPKDDGGTWLLEELHSRPLGYRWMKARWGDHFDAMIFNRVMKPSTPN